jgi:hypothetical protein
MRKLSALTVVLAALALAGLAAAAPNGAEVITQDSCDISWFGTVCTTVHATTKTTATPSGNLIYATNGTAERRLTFSFGGSYTTKSDIHLVSVEKQGQTQTTSQRLVERTSYSSGTYALDCIGGFSFHYANGATQVSDYSYECSTP